MLRTPVYLADALIGHCLMRQTLGRCPGREHKLQNALPLKRHCFAVSKTTAYLTLLRSTGWNTCSFPYSSTSASGPREGSLGSLDATAATPSSVTPCF
uniref:Hexosyltransferase n=1 Tax=Haemonchus placei TaxID=6290 RepID=A0A0N4VU63_HAEPC